MVSWQARFRIGQYLKGSLWVVPLLGAVGGALLAQLTLLVDGNVRLPEAWRYSPGTASGVLTAIVAAMVGLLGFVVTISVLVVQSATGTLSPRFMRLWYRDRLQKATLAAFTSILTFSFALLRRVDEHAVPDLGVTLAGFAVPSSLVLLLLYLDRFTHRLRPVAVAAIVARAGRRVVVARSPTGWSTADPPRGPVARVVRADRDGADDAINERGLAALARQHRDGQARLQVPAQRWVDYLELAITEVRTYGATSAQVTRRLADLLTALHERVLPQHRAAVLVEVARLAATVDRAIADPAERAFSRRPDRQGIGGPRSLPASR